MTTHRDESSEVDVVTGQDRRNARNRAWLRRIFGGMILLLVGFTVIQNFQQNAAQQRLVQCQGEVFSKFTEALKARTDATTADRESLDKMVFAITNASKQGDVRRALDEYAKTRKAADEARAANPYPDTTLSEECSDG